jgi:hypothetical protein
VTDGRKKRRSLNHAQTLIYTQRCPYSRILTHKSAHRRSSFTSDVANSAEERHSTLYSTCRRCHFMNAVTYVLPPWPSSCAWTDTTRLQLASTALKARRFNSETLDSAHTQCLRVSYDNYNKQASFPYTASASCFF